jgi:hypothetical protein
MVAFSAVMFLFPAWRIFSRAGFAPATALTVLIPFIGPFVAMAILAFAEWPAAGGRAEHTE